MKKSFFISIISVLLFLVMFSCKKDETSTPDYLPGFTGGWKYFNGPANQKYLQINLNRTFSILSSDKQGIRDRNNGILLVTANQIMFDVETDGEYSGVYIYNYAFNGDSLILSKPSETITLVKDNSTPETEEWIKSVTAVSKIKAPVSEATDITYDGTYLWYGNGYSSDYLYRINPNNSAKDSIPTTQSAWAVESDGTSLWVSSNGSSPIFKINKTNGSTTFTSINLGPWIYGIAKNNNFLWCYSNNENTLFKYNTTDNTIAESIEMDGGINGLAFVNNYLYVASNGKLNKCTTSPVLGISSFELPGYYIFGVAHDGTSFWVSANKYSEDEEWPEIIKLSGVE